jgi:aryl-alcohol dehydrogenase-like predicted oxidoreductase
MKLALGTAQFGLPYGISNKNGIVKREAVKKIIYQSNRLGIDTIDTAKNYGDCEELLGNIGVGKFKVVTKIPIASDKNINIDTFVKQNVNDSLSKLKLENLDTVLLHDTSFNNNIKKYETFYALERLKCDGKISKIGVSVYDPLELKDIIDNFNIDIVQIPLNLIDRRFEKKSLLKELHTRKIEIHSRSTFLQGLLLMGSLDLPEFFKKWSNLFKDFQDWTEKNNISKIRACLNYPISLSSISRIVIAVNNINQFNEIINIYNKNEILEFPDLSINDVDLIDPRNWR